MVRLPAIALRLLDIAVLLGDAVAVRTLVDRCGPCRILRLWTWHDLVIAESRMVADLPGGSGPAKDVTTCFRTHHFREPRVVEAAVLAGLDFSRLNGASDCLYILSLIHI